ncbi:MAG: hypothetical protein R3B09_22110 [Nannocystaceae bacterium]
MAVHDRSPLRLGAATLAAWALVWAPDRARAGAAADAARADIQVRYEGCLADLDAGRHADAAACLGRVYHDLIAIDPNTRADLYYVLADAVTARTAAAAEDPIHLCEAKVLVDDYLERERETQLLRFRRKVLALQRSLEDGLAEARAKTSRDPCSAPRRPIALRGWIDAAGAASATNPDPATPQAPTNADPSAPADADPSAPADADPSAPTDAAPPDAAPARPTPSSAPKPIRPASSATRSSPRKLGLEASTALMDAGFIITIAGGGVTGLGAALYAADLECSEGPPRCPEPTSPGVRHAGLALMSIGAAALFTGIVLRWADQRRLRRLRTRVGSAAAPISIAF